MRRGFQALIFGFALFVPLAVSAQQPTDALTRSQVRDELVLLEQAGYDPQYPASLSIAQDRLSGKTTKSNSLAPKNLAQSLYFGL